jgi:hypothetical protein
MDIITAAIAGALGNLGATAVLKSFNELKAVVQRKFGEENDVTDAVKMLEKKPGAEDRRVTLQKEVQEAGADKDADIVKAAEALLAEVKKQPGGEEAVQQIVNQQVIGNGNIFSGTGDVTVTR